MENRLRGEVSKWVVIWGLRQELEYKVTRMLCAKIMVGMVLPIY